MNYTKQYVLLKEQALRFHEVCTHFSLYTEFVDEATFLSLIDDFLIRMTQPAGSEILEPSEMGAKLEKATKYLEQFMHPYLPVTEDAVLDVLERVTKEFYQSLAQAQLLTPAKLSFNELLEKKQLRLEVRAQAIVDGHESLVNTCIFLPSIILGQLRDVVPQMVWDSEWGGEALLECIEQYFEQLSFEFEWQFDKQTDLVTCRVDTYQWVIDTVSHKEYDGIWDDIKIYEESYRQLNAYFVRHKLVLMDVPDWSQAMLWLLVPSEHLDNLNKFLGNHESAFYVVVPHLAVPDDF